MEKDETYEVYRKKGLRLEAEMSPLLYKYFYSPMRGRAWKGFHMMDKAHTVMLTETGIISPEIGKHILKAMRTMEAEGAETIREELGGHMHCGEAYVAKVMGPEVSGWIHCGRSSGDLVAVGNRVDLRDSIISIMEALIRIQKTLLKLGEEHIDTVMPGYTHLQHAEPITFGFYLLSFFHQFERDFERYENAYRHTNISPAGCAILTTTDFPIDRKRTQELLGFDGIFLNAKDAIWTMDHFVECLAAMMSTAGILSRLADDIHIWHSSEFGMVEVPDAFCGTSSIMPQKKNPYGTETVRGLNGDVIGSVMTFLAQTNRQSDSCEMVTMSPLCLYDAREKSLAALEIMNGVVNGLKVNKGKMRERAGMFWAQATSLANRMVTEKGMPFRSAHETVAILVRIAYEEGKSPSEITTEIVDKAAIEATGKPLGFSESSVREALDPEYVVKSKTPIGGTAPDRVREDVKNGQDVLAGEEKALARIKENLSKSEIVLEEAIDRIIGS